MLNTASLQVCMYAFYFSLLLGQRILKNLDHDSWKPAGSESSSGFPGPCLVLDKSDFLTMDWMIGSMIFWPWRFTCEKSMTRQIYIYIGPSIGFFCFVNMPNNNNTILSCVRKFDNTEWFQKFQFIHIFNLGLNDFWTFIPDFFSECI